jgi:CRISPR/Cas system CSM-associated protein Csm2 small subunit
MANTSVQISKKIKNKLFELLNRLEKKWGRRITFDEAIEFLLEEKVTKVNKEEFLNNIKRFQGILKGEARSLLIESRRVDLEREERYTNR